MHFWIDKRSQTCGFPGRYQIPPSISGYGRNQRTLCRNFYPKPPMVTPVHRFQSIESVANNSIRVAARSSSSSAAGATVYHNNGRLQNTPAHPHYNGPTNNPQILQMEASSMDNPALRRTQCCFSGPRNRHRSCTYTDRLKCVVWFSFVIIAFILAGSKYYGIKKGLEALCYFSLLLALLGVAALISIYKAISAYMHANSSNAANNPVTQTTEPQNVPVVEPNPIQEPQNTEIVPNSELPPPPYHIAIMLTPQQNNSDVNAQIIRDSPPPSYEKAMT